MTMSILMFMQFLFIIINAEMHCYSTDDHILQCRGLELKSHEAIRLNTSFPVLLVDLSRGSIGPKTFSLMSHLEELRIMQSVIHQIEDGTLCSLTNLENLILQSNYKFPELTQSVLSNCEKISSLTLGNVQMKPDALKNLSNVKNLIIVDQGIPHLTVEYLEPLRNLKELHFFNSTIGNIDDGAFCLSPKLEKLLITRSSLPPLTKKAFENCNSVNKFIFEDNGNVIIQEETFSGFQNLQMASLNQLQIKRLTKAFLYGLNSVEHLKISEASITVIDANAFQGFDHLSSLDLSHNNLENLDPKFLTYLPNLRILYLVETKLNSIDNFRHPTLNSLDVTSNVISEIDTKIVKANLPSLTFLNIMYNNMSRGSEEVIKNELKRITVLITPKPGDYSTLFNQNS